MHGFTFPSRSKRFLPALLIIPKDRKPWSGFEISLRSSNNKMQVQQSSPDEWKKSRSFDKKQTAGATKPSRWMKEEGSKLWQETLPVDRRDCNLRAQIHPSYQTDDLGSYFVDKTLPWTSYLPKCLNRVGFRNLQYLCRRAWQIQARFWEGR